MDDSRYVKRALVVVFDSRYPVKLHKSGSLLMNIPVSIILYCSSFSELEREASAHVDHDK